MPAPLDVDREQVRMLVLAVGCSEAARQTGINLNTILQWSSRFEWLKPVAVKPLPVSMAPTPVIGVINPGDALANTLKQRKNETLLGLSEWASESASSLGKLRGEEARCAASEAKLTADVMGKVWPEQQTGQNQTAVIVSVNVLGSTAQYETIADMPIAGAEQPLESLASGEQYQDIASSSLGQ